jgi:hypothetical protein
MKRFCIATALALALATTTAVAEELAVYVSATAGNNGYSGLTTATPVATIAQALIVAANAGRTRVHVAGGTYQAFAMANGIDVIGGFDSQFVQSAAATPATTAIVQAAYAPSHGMDISVIAQGITRTSSPIVLRPAAVERC